MLVAWLCICWFPAFWNLKVKTGKEQDRKESLGQGLAKARCLEGQGLSPGLGPARSYGFVGLGQGLIIGALASRRRQKSPGLGGLKGPQGL